MLCCYYPTTIGIIDDDKDFLRTLSQHMSLPNCESFSSPRKAIQYFSQYNSFERLRSHLQTSTNQQNPIDTKSENIFFQINIKKLHEEIYSSERFRDVSVIIVDYYMDEMNGIDVCQQLSHLPMKKIFSDFVSIGFC